MKLIQTVGYDQLMQGILYSDIINAADLLTPMVDTKSPTLGLRMTVTLAYLIGEMQGVHDERERRRNIKESVLP